MSTTSVYLKDLFSLFHEIETGAILVPSFQRNFAWKHSDILALLDSVYNGFPIGMLLFFESRDEVFDSHPFPYRSPLSANKFSPQRKWYVIDGFQRLTSLYTALYVPPINKPSTFRISFNFETKTFSHSKAKKKRLEVDVSSIFSDQQDDFGIYDYEEVRSQMNSFYHTFSSYQVPVSIFSELDSDGIVEVFQRINARGQALSKQDLQRLKDREQSVEKAAPESKFEIIGKPGGLYVFELKTTKGVVLTSTAFETKDEAEYAIDSLRSVAGDSRSFMRLNSPEGRKYFVVRDRTGKVIAESKQGKSSKTLESNIQLVRGMSAVRQSRGNRKLKQPKTAKKTD